MRQVSKNSRFRRAIQYLIPKCRLERPRYRPVRNTCSSTPTKNLSVITFWKLLGTQSLKILLFHFRGRALCVQTSIFTHTNRPESIGCRHAERSQIEPESC